MNTRKVMIVAGEASGDLHGGNLVREMHRIDPNIIFSGVGGERMRTEGVKLLADAADMAVVGLTEVFLKLRTMESAVCTLVSPQTVINPTPFPFIFG